MYDDCKRLSRAGLVPDLDGGASAVRLVTGRRASYSGPPSPLLRDGTGYRPQHNNYHPSGIITVGWSVSEAVAGKQVPEYWHYRVRTSTAWIPAGGNVKAITTDADGAAVNDIYAVRPSDLSRDINYWGTSGVGFTALTRAWASAAYARDFSRSGAILIANGGDGDYYGTEVYAFDFDVRRWTRLCEPHRNMTGSKPGNPFAGVNTDHRRDPTDPLYFSRFECEHGPLIPHDHVGLLPTRSTPTTPGCPYLRWNAVPAGQCHRNKRSIGPTMLDGVYNQSSTTRAHYSIWMTRFASGKTERPYRPFHCKAPDECLR
jgi:hypothetical protein